ncbi:MAG: hypothetical protein WCA07_14140 [Gloeobacterales cyanobacterium]
MTQPFPTEDPKLPLAPWEESSLGDDFDVSKTHGAEVFYLGDEADEQPPHPQPPDQEVEAGFPWQSSSLSNQRTTSSKPLPWEVKDISSISSGQSYQTQPRPQVPPVSPSRPSPPKNLLQPKKFTSDIWQNVPISGYVTAAAVLVLGMGVVWTANGLSKDSTVNVPQSAIVAKNSTVGADGGTSSASIPVRPLRSRVVPGSSSNEASKPGYMPEATPARPMAPLLNGSVNSSDSTSSGETSSESSTESMYLSPLAASSAEAGAEGGPQNPFAPAYPAPKPAEEPKPTLTPPPVRPLPLPPPPKVLPAVLSLEGVATDGKTKLAIVRVGDQPLTAEVQVGTTIEGWTVTAIKDQTVTLRKYKQQQVLRLP